ncbi:hypothetical protein Syun_030503 [Stephania yunnanensis]|uniref:Uncharacterized protein n=1 Tax=Stephania yunnanensis TaxID=152371 RepID=A0AAP0DXB2_9MAGN
MGVCPSSTSRMLGMETVVAVPCAVATSPAVVSLGMPSSEFSKGSKKRAMLAPNGNAHCTSSSSDGSSL